MHGYYGMPQPAKVGPYAEGAPQPHGDQIALQHLFSTNTWNRAWGPVFRAIAPDFVDPSIQDGEEPGDRWNRKFYWRNDLWKAAVQYCGVEGLEMLREGGVEKWRPRLEEIGAAVEKIQEEDKPKIHKWGGRLNLNYNFPNMLSDVHVLMCGYW